MKIFFLAASLLCACALDLLAKDPDKIQIQISLENLKLLDAAAAYKCSSIEKGRAEIVEGLQVPVIHSAVDVALNDITKACAGKSVHQACVVMIEGSPAAGVCLTDFVTSSTVPRCIIGEVLQGSEPCSERNPMDFCVVNVTMGEAKQDLRGGICGHDSQGQGIGCYTPRGAKFLQTLERDTIQPFKSVAAKITLKGMTWHNVMVRRHGGSSLCSSMNRKSKKLPLYLDFRFSKFETATAGEYISADYLPFNFSRAFLKGNSFADPSLLRQYVGSMLAEKSQMIVPPSSFARVFVNNLYIGLYTLIADPTSEEIQSVFHSKLGDEPPLLHKMYRAVRTQFANNANELGVAEGDWFFVTNETESSEDASSVVTAVHAFHQDVSGSLSPSLLAPLPCNELPGTVYEPLTSFNLFQPNNFVPIDGAPVYPWYAHALALHTALHNKTRLENPVAWREDLEKVIDIRNGPAPLLLFLAVNTALGNWDSYGQVPHNFQLFSRACSGKLSILGNDFDQIWTTRSKSMTVNWSSVTATWPLVRFVLDDPVYKKEYLLLLSRLMKSVFDLDVLNQLKTLHKFIRPYVHPDEGGEDEDVTKVLWYHGFIYIHIVQVDYDAFDDSLKEIQASFKALRQSIMKDLKKIQPKKAKEEL